VSGAFPLDDPPVELAGLSRRFVCANGRCAEVCIGVGGERPLIIPLGESWDFAFDVCDGGEICRSDEPPLRGLEVTMKEEDRGGYFDGDAF